MKEDNVPYSNITYSILIKLYTTLERIEEALGVLDRMHKEDIRPGLIVYTCLIQGCIKLKYPEKILPIYKDMQANKISGDTVLFNTLISGLLFNGYLIEAIDFTLDTLDKNIFLNSDVYHNLLRNLVKLFQKKLRYK